MVMPKTIIDFKILYEVSVFVVLTVCLIKMIKVCGLFKEIKILKQPLLKKQTKKAIIS